MSRPRGCVGLCGDRAGRADGPRPTPGQAPSACLTSDRPPARYRGCVGARRRPCPPPGGRSAVTVARRDRLPESRFFGGSRPSARARHQDEVHGSHAKRPTWHVAQVGRSRRSRRHGAGALRSAARPSLVLTAPCPEGARLLRSCVCGRAGRVPTGAAGGESHLGDTRPMRPRGAEVGQRAIRHRRQRRATGPRPDARPRRATLRAPRRGRGSGAHGMRMRDRHGDEG